MLLKSCMKKISKQQQHAVERIQRSKVTASTMAQVPVDTWLLICTHMFSSPHHVFRLMVACRGVWGALKQHRAWWEVFFQRVMQYQEVLSVSPYVKVLQRYRTHGDKHRVLKLVFVRICETCGAKQGHTLLHPLMARLCTLCVQQRVVSNRVLLKRYGLHFSDFLIPYHASGGVVIAHRQNVKRSLDHSTSLLWLTCDPLDFETRHVDRISGFRHQLLFFSVKEVERVLGTTLVQARQRHVQRLEALERISAQCRMFNARRAMANAYITVQDILVNDRWNRIQSSLRQQQLMHGRGGGRSGFGGSTLLMGGPFMISVSASSYRQVLRLRPSIRDDDLARLRALIDGASML